ncbi:hypothetical protein XENOCAPTIV_029049, partial [Xenoophorus captivus]
WRWKMDPAEEILQDALEKHQNMIRQFRGVPGVKPERYEEGLSVKHCALSLPNVLLIRSSCFSRNLVPVTQLYVSVDASTKDSLKKIDRPLFKDFWPRFLDSLRALGEKAYSELIALGQPDFIEVKICISCYMSFLHQCGSFHQLERNVLLPHVG